jgi:hypothetical protein
MSDRETAMGCPPLSIAGRLRGGGIRRQADDAHAVIRPPHTQPAGPGGLDQVAQQFAGGLGCGWWVGYFMSSVTLSRMASAQIW